MKENHKKIQQKDTKPPMLSPSVIRFDKKVEDLVKAIDLLGCTAHSESIRRAPKLKKRTSALQKARMPL